MLGLLLILSKTQANEIDWSCINPHRIFDHTGITALNTNNWSSKGDTSSALIQLVYAGANGTADVAYTAANTNGQTLDDVVVAWKWIGFGVNTVSTNAGRFNISGVNAYSNNYANGSEFFIRAWELPSSALGTGYVPTNSSPVYYGDSALFTVQGNLPIPQIDQFTITQDFSTTIQAIPEPTTWVVCLLLGGGIVTIRRLRK